MKKLMLVLVAVMLFGFVGKAQEQDGWSWCKKCNGLWYSGFNTTGKCPAGGGHIKTESFNYTMFYNSCGECSGQSDWKYCKNCLGMWYGGWAAQGKMGVCPAGGAHTDDTSNNYIMCNLDNGGKMNFRQQEGWRYCNKCLGFYYGDFNTNGTCPAGGSHNKTDTYNYVLKY